MLACCILGGVGGVVLNSVGEKLRGARRRRRGIDEAGSFTAKSAKGAN